MPYPKLPCVSLKAFGLVELMVSISIMTLVTTVILVRQNAFNGAVLLRNQAYEVAFTIRQAQLLAVSGGDDTARRYGVYFATTDGLNQRYILFRDDLPYNGEVDAGEQVGATGQVDGRFEVRGLEVDGDDTPEAFSVVFERPNFDAIICETSCDTTITSAYVDVAKIDNNGDGAGDVRRVQVSGAGEISVVTYP